MKEKAKILVFEDEPGGVDYIAKPFEMTDFIFRIISHVKPKSSFDTLPATKGVVT